MIEIRRKDGSLKYLVDSYSDMHRKYLDLSYADFTCKVLHGVKFSGLTVINANFNGANLASCDFVKSNCYNSTFDVAALIACNMSMAMLDYCSFINTSMRSSNFSSSYMGNVTLKGVDISFCNTKFTNFRQVKAENVVGGLDSKELCYCVLRPLATTDWRIDICKDIEIFGVVSKEVIEHKEYDWAINILNKLGFTHSN